MLLSATLAQVMGVEAEHQALIRQMGGLVPSNRTLKQALFYNTSEVAPLFQPFLEGGNGFAGPVAFPGVDEINSLVADEGVVATVPFIQLTNGLGTMSMTPEAMAAATGVCTISGINVNIRSAPEHQRRQGWCVDSGSADASHRPVGRWQRDHLVSDSKVAGCGQKWSLSRATAPPSRPSARNLLTG